MRHYPRLTPLNHPGLQDLMVTLPRVKHIDKHIIYFDGKAYLKQALLI